MEFYTDLFKQLLDLESENLNLKGDHDWFPIPTPLVVLHNAEYDARCNE